MEKNRGVGTATNRYFEFHKNQSRPQSRRKSNAEKWICLESLESRVLLTGDLQAVPFFIVNHSPVPNPDAIGGPDGLWPSQVRKAYGIDQVMFGNVVGDGTGQTIAIVDAYNEPNIVEDLHAFDQQFGLPDPTLIRLNQRGGTQLPANDFRGGWGVEIALDVEWVHVVAPKATIVLVLTDNNSFANLAAGVNIARSYPNVSVVSMSWGAGESTGDPPRNASYTTPAGHTGVTFVASTGDNGAFGAYGSKWPAFPAISPNVLAVGGTRLTLDDSDNYLSESGWGDGENSGINGGAGGGISRIEAQPVYQQGLVTQSTLFRTTPDVAMVADPESGVAIYDSYDYFDWSVVGGTSLAAPLWAGVIGLANQGRVLAGGGTLDGVTETLPKIYSLSSVDFHDITTGNNGFPTLPGYDLVTGRGTPLVNLVVADLSRALSIGALNVSPTPVISGTGVQVTASNIVSELGNKVTGVTFYRETNGTPGLQIGSDLTLGQGVSSGASWRIFTNTQNFLGGQFKYYAIARDAANNNSSIAEATLTIASPKVGSLTITPASLKSGGSITLTGTNVVEAVGGTVASVKVYLESNSTAGLQTNTDTFIGNMILGGTATAPKWTLTTTTTGLVPGSYTYYAVGTDSANLVGEAKPIVLTVLPPPPVNDNFANATIIAGLTVAVTGTNVSATKEKGEPAHAKNTGGASAWWTWTAPVSGQVTLDTAGSDFDSLLGVYTGTKVSPLKQIAANDNIGSLTHTSSVVFNVIAGTVYQIAVDGFKGATGNIDLNLNEIPAPPNNNFIGAATLSGLTATWTGTNAAATRENLEPKILNNLGGASVWFTWTAPSTGRVNIDTLGSAVDTILGVYTGTKISPLKLIASNDNANSLTTTSAVSFRAIGGTVYQIAVDGSKGVVGNLTLNLAETPAPLNDNFINAEILTGETATWNGSNAVGTRETSEPKILLNPGGASVWFKWVAPTSRAVTINTTGSDFDTLLAVYTGTKVSALKLVSANNDAAIGVVTSTLTFNAIAGTTYWIAVDGVQGVVGNITLNLS